MITTPPEQSWDMLGTPFHVVVALFACLVGFAPQYGAALPEGR
ncbi:MAG: hypothetical protein P0119_09915 [Nitrospira sp.]|nr:hypothetical protein [Nitrospira sp.]